MYNSCIRFHSHFMPSLPTVIIISSLPRNSNNNTCKIKQNNNNKQNSQKKRSLRVICNKQKKFYGMSKPKHPSHVPTYEYSPTWTFFIQSRNRNQQKYYILDVHPVLIDKIKQHGSTNLIKLYDVRIRKKAAPTKK